MGANNNNNVGENIIDLSYYINSLRHTGYKNIVNAIAEIVDNSLEAKAQDVLVICTLKSGRRGDVVSEIAILDNGCGMDDVQAKKCLAFGASTRRERRGMGRFGVGLPQASLYACPRVEVYTWQNSQTINHVYLDAKEIQSKGQKGLKMERVPSVPDEFKKYINNFNFKVERDNIKMDFSHHGTLVVWRRCDKVNPKTFNSLRQHCQEQLGRKFRYFISQDSNRTGHDKKCNIAIVAINGESHNFNPVDENNTLLKPNDPLYLMQDNMWLGDPSNPQEPQIKGKPLFEPWEYRDAVCIGSKEFKIPCRGKHEGETGTVKVSFSMAKACYRAEWGSSGIGKTIAKNVGISVVRANREIDFGNFDFFDEVNQPQHRWWGCEIQFEPNLDEVFGVTNDKQYVEFLKGLLKKSDHSLASSKDLQKQSIEDYCHNEGVDVEWGRLHIFVKTLIKNMYEAFKQDRKGSRTKDVHRALRRKEEMIVQHIEKNNKIPTKSSELKAQNEGEAFKKAKENIMHEGTPDPSKEEVLKTQELPIKISTQQLGERRPFIEVDKKAGNAWLIINQDASFYTDVYVKIQELSEQHDPTLLQAFHLFLMAFARAEDEAYGFNEQLHEAFGEVRDAWSKKIRQYLKSDYKA